MLHMEFYIKISLIRKKVVNDETSVQKKWAIIF